MESPRSMLRIFVDDASVDLHAHRHAARRLIEKFDEHAVVMEDFGAQDTARLLSRWPGSRAAVSIFCCSPGETLSVTHNHAYGVSRG